MRDRLGGHAGDQGQLGQQLLWQTPPELLDRPDRQGQGLQAEATGDGAAHIADHQMGRRQPQLRLGGQQPGHRTQIAAGAEDMNHPLALPHQPAIQPAAPGGGARQQGAIEIGDQHQLRLGRELGL